LLASNGPGPGVLSFAWPTKVGDQAFSRLLETQHGLFQILLRLQVRLPLSHHCAPKTRSSLRPPHNPTLPVLLPRWLAVHCGLVRMHDTIPTLKAWAPPSAMRSSQLLHFAAAKTDKNRGRPSQAVSARSTLFCLPLQPDTRAVRMQDHSGITAEAGRQPSSAAPASRYLCARPGRR